MKPDIIIGSKNKFKEEKLRWVVENFFSPKEPKEISEADEDADSFIKIAEDKARHYSQSGGYAISTDGGAIIPVLEGVWDPVHTKRFADSDHERIYKLLSLMEGKSDRTIEWHEALAVAKDGVLIYSDSQKAMDGVIDTTFNEKYYQPGIWLCSITSFPTFDGKNFFELSESEREQTEDSWTKLKANFESKIISLL